MKYLNKKFCVIGTDTGIGKTYITCNILKTLKIHNYKVKAIKPIATGQIQIANKMINEDAYLLSKEINIKMADHEINPICFVPPIAPHIAAAIAQYSLTAHDVIDKCAPVIISNNYDYLIIEGVGGLMVPLNNNETYLDILQAWNFPVILVVGIKLGCINHALLTYNQLINQKVPLCGWVANCIDPQMSHFENNIEYLQSKLSCPLIGVNYFQQELTTNPNFNHLFL